jgi:RNA polymerase sigma-70 factor (ECF subfamily)
MSKSEKERMISNEADVVLMDLIREKDEPALSKLYDRRSGFVYSLAYSIVGNRSDAEEITEEVFFRVWQKAASFDKSRGSVMAWMAIIARRLAIDKTRSGQFKSRTKEVSINAATSSDNNPVIAGKGDTASIEAAADAGALSDALGQLRDDYSQVVRLSYYEGLSHSKIAERLNTPLGTVKTRIREAVIQLRQILGLEA